MSKKIKDNKALVKELILIIFSFVIGALVMLCILKYTSLPVLTNNKLTNNKTKIYEKTSLAPAIEKIYDAVVVVQGYSSDELKTTGSGFVYKVDEKYGYILTNEHVLSEDNKVVLSTDEEISVKVLGKDQYLDLAVLRIAKKYVTLVATITSSENINLGDTVFTVGAPLGYDYRGSVTSGILSGKDRMVATSVSDTDESDWLMQVLQIDASINPGNSGGPLLNVNGEVIGICSMKLIDDDIEGMGFAIPIEYATSHVTSLEKGEKIKWPLLGIGMINVTDHSKLIRNNISVADDIKEGIVVYSIKKNTGAEKANLKKGDIIIKINEEEVKDIAHLKYELYKHQAGEEIEITYIRNKHEKKTKIILSSSE